MESTAAARRGRLPERQPRRALIVTTSYALTVGGAFFVLPAALGTIGVLFAGMLACALLLPVAIVAPSPRPEPAANPMPVLLRPRR